MKFYNLNIQKNLNYYFIISYTQINFRLFKDFSFLPKNLINKYRSLVWLDFNYKYEIKRGNISVSDSKLVSLKVFNNYKLPYKYTKYLEITLLNFSINKFVFNELRDIVLDDDSLNIGFKFDYNFLSVFLKSLDYIYIYKLISKTNYTLLFTNYNIINCFNFKTLIKSNYSKNYLSTKPTFSLNFKFL